MRIARDGAFLGSEEELLTRYGVSRPTLRQAARIVEHEQLITVRRGVHGGFFTRLPTSEAVTRVASVFLQLNGTTVDDLLRAVSSFVPTLATLACAAPIDERVSFADWVKDNNARVSSMRRREFIEYVAEHGRRLGALANCPPLALFQNVLMELTLEERTVNVFADRSRMDVIGAYHLRLAGAIRKGDGPAASRLARANTELTEGWLRDDA